MSILERLRRETAATHARLDAAVELEARVGDPDERVRLVQAFHAFHAAAQRVLAKAPPGFDPCSRLPALAADLEALGAEPLPAPGSPSTDPSRALGWLYVVEGSSLGGHVLRRGLESRQADMVGLSFLDPYGAGVGVRWRETVAFLESQAARPDIDPAAVVSGACDAFEFAYGTLAFHVDHRDPRP